MTSCKRAEMGLRAPFWGPKRCKNILILKNEIKIAKIVWFLQKYCKNMVIIVLNFGNFNSCVCNFCNTIFANFLQFVQIVVKMLQKYCKNRQAKTIKKGIKNIIFAKFLQIFFAKFAKFLQHFCKNLQFVQIYLCFCNFCKLRSLIAKRGFCKSLRSLQNKRNRLRRFLSGPALVIRRKIGGGLLI